MKIGEICELYCTSPYAYGEKGSGENIPPNSTLKFEIELIRCNFPAISKDYEIRRQILSKGEGYKKPNDGAKCEVQIEGKVGATIFSNMTKKHILISEYEKDLPEGVHAAIRKMTKGEKSKIFIDPGVHHFAKDELPNGVTSNDILEYTIELIDFENV